MEDFYIRKVTRDNPVNKRPRLLLQKAELDAIDIKQGDYVIVKVKNNTLEITKISPKDFDDER